MTFDLNAFALDTEARPLHLVDPNDEVTPLYADKDETKPLIINLYGTASKAHKKAVEIITKKANNRGKRKPSNDEVREESAEFLVTLTASAENLVLGGEAIETPEQFKALYNNPKFSWIRNQCDSFVSDTTNFLD